MISKLSKKQHSREFGLENKTLLRPNWSHIFIAFILILRGNLWLCTLYIDSPSVIFFLYISAHWPLIPVILLIGLQTRQVITVHLSIRFMKCIFSVQTLRTRNALCRPSRINIPCEASCDNYYPLYNIPTNIFWWLIGKMNSTTLL